MEKKLFSKLMLAMLIALPGIAFTACGDNNDEPKNPETWKTVYMVKFDISNDFFKTAEITAHVVEPNGTRRELTDITKNIDWALIGENIPDQAAVLLTFVPKKDISETDSYYLKIKGDITAISYKNGEVFDSKTFSIPSSGLSMKGDKVAEYLTGRGVGLASGIDENGKVVSVKVEDIDFGLNNIWKWLAEVIADSDRK